MLLRLALCWSAALVAGGSGAAVDRRDEEGGALSRQEVVQWHALLYESTNALGAPGGGSSALRGWAMLSLAMYESSNAVAPRYTPYIPAPSAAPHDTGTLLPTAEEAAQRVAVARAAQIVLDGLFAPPPSQPDSPLGPTRAFAHAQQFAIHTAALDLAAPAYLLGMEIGTAVGERILAERAGAFLSVR